MKTINKIVGIASLVFGLSNSASALTMDKVLTVSANDYVASQGKTLADYTMIGVNDCLSTTNYEVYEQEKEVPKLIQSIFNGIYGISAPTRTEVVVGFRLIPTSGNMTQIICYSGTALIPKQKKTTQKKEKQPSK